VLLLEREFVLGLRLFAGTAGQAGHQAGQKNDRTGSGRQDQ
jgi:hypothetical protein